jgi:Rps23 Pro-64 3,4-dihydroxylase Tpa1-like proline 4-hydroxylase
MINYKFKIKSIHFPKSKILIIDNFLKEKYLRSITNEIDYLLKNSNDRKPYFKKYKSKKIEFLNHKNFLKNQKKFIKILKSEKFKKFIQKKLEIEKKIIPDSSNMFSGFNVVEKGGFLRPHADFNFNNKLKLYRSINLLIYFNKNWKKKYGGNLIMYNYSNMKKKYEFIAKENRAVIFLTNKFTPHGYKKITTEMKRFSLNYYYYTKENYSYTEAKHKTIWR